LSQTAAENQLLTAGNSNRSTSMSSRRRTLPLSELCLPINVQVGNERRRLKATMKYHAGYQLR